MSVKKIFFGMIILSSILAFSSCTIVNNDDRGTLVIRNKSEDITITIVEVAETKDDNREPEYYSIKRKSIRPQTTEYIKIDPGYYPWVRITTDEIEYDYIYGYYNKYYTTYRPKIWIDKDNYAYYVFDGKDFYFEK